jgi:hypothetical protein
MIRSEAVILAIFGAIIGIIVGTGMGIALVSSLKQQGITDTVGSPSSLVMFLLLAALLGLIAAGWPARRAARLDVLAAIAAQLCAPRGRLARGRGHAPAFVRKFFIPNGRWCHAPPLDRRGTRFRQIPLGDSGGISLRWKLLPLNTYPREERA